MRNLICGRSTTSLAMLSMLGMTLALACTTYRSDEGGGDEVATLETESDSGDDMIEPGCGNGVVESGEECDLGEANDDAGKCTSSCTIAACGRQRARIT